eukprot:g1478.t1
MQSMTPDEPMTPDESMTPVELRKVYDKVYELSKTEPLEFKRWLSTFTRPQRKEYLALYPPTNSAANAATERQKSQQELDTELEQLEAELLRLEQEVGKDKVDENEKLQKIAEIRNKISKIGSAGGQADLGSAANNAGLRSSGVNFGYTHKLELSPEEIAELEKMRVQGSLRTQGRSALLLKVAMAGGAFFLLSYVYFKWNQCLFQVGDFVNHRYKLRYIIKQGRNSVVFAAVDTFTNTSVAIKVVEKSFWWRIASAAKLENEVKVLQYLSRHTALQIVRPLEIIETASATCIVMEFAGGDLLDLMLKKKGRFPEKEAAFFIAQIAKGVQQLHNIGILHRDIKPENILLIDSECRICDFGLAKRNCTNESEQCFASLVCGSTGFQAPEVREPGKCYGYAADWFSVGVILYILLAGYPPFDIDIDERPTFSFTHKNYKTEARFDHDCWKSISLEARHLVSKLLATNSFDRYNGNDLLQSPWLQKHLK